MTLRETRPAGHPDAAIFATDAGQIAQAWVAAMQIAALEPDRRFDIVVAASDIDDLPEVARTSPIRFRRIDVSAVPPFVHGNSRITIGTFFRHLLPAQLSGEYRALFYMDTDTWMRRPGLQGLFDRRLPGLPLAAAPTFIYHPALCGRPHPVSRRAAQILAAFPRADGLHWQSGVQMIDTTAHVRADIAGRIFAYVRDHHALLAEVRLGDQGALHGVIGADAVLLDPRWNWHHETWMTPELLQRFDPHLLHFIGKAKPWQRQDDPVIAGFHAPWVAGLRAWQPDWAAEAAPRSSAWYEDHPATGIAALDAAHRAWRRARARGRQRQPRTPATIAAMQRMIDAAVIA